MSEVTKFYYKQLFQVIQNMNVGNGDMSPEDMHQMYHWMAFEFTRNEFGKDCMGECLYSDDLDQKAIDMIKDFYFSDMT